MASRGQSLTLTFVDWNTSTNSGQTGDAANMTLRWVKDGTSAAPDGSPTITEIDSTNCPGLYKITLDSADCTCNFGCLAGKTTTANCSIIPVPVTFEQLPTVAPGTATTGLPLLNSAGNVSSDLQTIKTQSVTASAGVIFPNTISSFAGGAVASVTGNIGGNVVGSIGSISGVSFPANFGTLAITSGQGIGTSTLTAGAQMDLVNAPNATAIDAIQSGLALETTAESASSNAAAAASAAGEAVSAIGTPQQAGEPVTLPSPAPSGYGPGSGTGAYVVTITVNDGTNPIQNATVSLSQGASVFTGLTNSSGGVSFSLNAATYNVAITAAGYSFTPTTLVVTGNQSQTYSMTQNVVPTPPTIGTTNGYLTTYDAQGDIIAGVVLTFTLISDAGTAGTSPSTAPFTVTSSGTSANNLVVQLVQNTTYLGQRGTGIKAEFTTGSAGTYQLPEILGQP